MTIVSLEFVENVITSLSSILESTKSNLGPIPSLPSLPTLTATFWRYLPFTPFIILLWPILISFIFTLTSASTWLFWLFTSLVFGIIQLIYVLYQFIMISFDLGVLSILKTYSTLRNIVRYYTLRSGLRTGSKRERDYVSKRGRKREWRTKMDAAKSLDDFLQIEIQEPPPREGALDKDQNNNMNNNHSAHSSQGRIQHSQPAPNKQLSLRRVQSYHSTSPSRDLTSAKFTYAADSSNSKVAIKKPSVLFHRSKSNHEINKGSSNTQNKTNTPDYSEIEHELGMTGTMLLQTTYRLKETRMQASSTYSSHLSSQHGYSGNDGSSSNSSSCINESEYEDDDDDDGEGLDLDLQNITGTTTTTGAINLTINPMIDPQYHHQQRQHQENIAASQLKFLLQGVVKRNHLSINDLLIQDASSVMDCGRHHLSEQSRNVIFSYHEEVEQCLEWIAHSGLEKQQYQSNSDVVQGNNKKHSSSSSGQPQADIDVYNGGQHVHSYNGQHNNNSNNDNTPEIKLYKEISDRLNLIRKLKHNMGRTALMLSGGGAQAMYHLGTIKALCESKLYDNIEVISGTSGGSIAAAMCAIKTRAELLKDVCVPHVSTDYGLTGEMKKKNIRWFPRITQMGEYWLKHKLLVDPSDFKRCCEFYFGDITFEEAFQRTGKHVCITVSASRAEVNGSGGGAQRLLLNHISTPHVTLASAVAASCALPGVMAPAKLVTKDSDSNQELFEVDGVEWIDGSVQADLPFKRISTLFNVSNYIVCQTNFHVLPFLHKAHHPDTKSFYWRAFQTCEWDIRNRALNLSRLGLFPKIFGQDISKVFKQKYHGDLTLVPRFTTMQVFGLKALVNPTYDDMEVYLQNGQSSAWPYLSVIREMLRLENAIDKCIKSLNERLNNLSPDNDWDDVESITSATTSRYASRTFGARRENELLKQKLHSLELENLEMKKQLEYYQKEYGLKLVVESAQSPTRQIEFIRDQEKRIVNKPRRFKKKDL